MSNDVKPNAILRVYHYDSGSKTIKRKSTLQIPGEKDITKIDLHFIRSILVQGKVLDSPDVSAPFCNTVGAKMKDSMTFSVYVDQLKEEQESAPAEEEESNVQKQEQGANPQADYKVYYRKRKKLAAVLNSAEAEFLKEQLDLKLQKAPTLKNHRAELLSAAFDSSQWRASSGEKLSVAANLSERDWSVITRVNCLLSGHKMTVDTVKVIEKPSKSPETEPQAKASDKEDGSKESKESKTLKVPSGVEKSPFNAFKLKARIFDEYEVAAPLNQDHTEPDPQTSHEARKVPFHIPRFRVDDASYVEVVETKNVVKTSLAKSSFSNDSLEASASGGFWGVSAAAKGGFAMSDEEKSLEADTTDHHKVHVSYNFPRVTVILDADSLQPTEEIKKDILKVTNKDALNAFSEKYGDIFARRVRLGGKLTSTSDVESKTKSTEKSREKALKVAAAASFSSPSASGSAEGSYSSGENSNTSADDQKFSSKLSWEATGGDTTLCNDPPSWCGTVGNYYNWRIVELDDVIPLPKFLSTFKDLEYVERRFQIAAGFEKVTAGMYVYTGIRLIEMKTQKPLRVSVTSNPLKTAVERIAKANPDISLSFSTPTEELLKQLSKGGVSIDEDQKDQFSVWTLARWVEKDEGRAYSYGSKIYLFNTAMPEGAKYLGATSKIAKVEGSGFLYPTTESEKAWFTLNTATKNPHASGFLEDGDIVEIRVRDKSDSADLGYLMRSSYVKKSEVGGDRTNSEIRKVPGFATRYMHEGNEQPKERSSKILQPNDERVLQFRVEIVKRSTEL